MGQNAVAAVQILGKAEQLGTVLIGPRRNRQVSAVFAALCLQRIAAVLPGANPVIVFGAESTECPFLAVQPVGCPLLHICVVCHFSAGNIHHQTGTGIFKSIDHICVHRTAGICCRL